jgi:hypothetical protein
MVGKSSLICLVFLLTIGSWQAVSSAAEYQWSAVVDSVTTKNGEHPRAFLWIPPTCRRVRAVVFGEHNMLEEDIFEHPEFRKAMADLEIAIVWISPSMDPRFATDESMARFNKLMKDLADVSGYDELELAPIIPLGHSAHASFPWNFASLAPSRTLAILSVHGDAPETPMAGFGGPNQSWGDRNIDGIPGLMVMGEWEWIEARLTPAMAYRQAHPKACIALLAEPGQGHFNACNELIRFLTMFIRKAAEQRLPDQSGAPLKPVDPTKGWLVERWTYNQGRFTQPAPFDKYLGDPTNAFWAFDEEMARATQNYFSDQNGKQPQLISFVQDGKIIPMTTSLEMQRLKFEPQDDGITFKLDATFLGSVTSRGPANDILSKNNYVRWARLPAGSPLGHATDGGPILFSRIEGPVQQTGPDTFRISYYRASASSQNTIWFYASHPGDNRFKSAVQQASMIVPRNNTGADQHITFPQIPAQKNGTATVTLAATSDSKLPVSYYVREGPAEVDGDSLKLTTVPPRAKLPLKVTVIAWQFGRSVTPKIATAEPVEHTFLITD